MRKAFLLPLLALSLARAIGAEPALTIYNQDFAVVRDTLPLDLKAGVNEVRFAEATAHLEPDSVILRDPAGKVPLQILEQNYRADPISQPLLLSLYEGKTIGFLVHPEDGKGPDHVVQGKIVRSGYVVHAAGLRHYGNRYANAQAADSSEEGGGQPIIEVDGKLRFTLPGEPIFPALGDDTVLKPRLDWKIQTDAPAKLEAELAYVTGGMTWEASYSVVSPEQGDRIDLTGLVTMDNQSGKSFVDAKIKLMAGNVNKINPDNDVEDAPVAGMASTVDQATRDVTVKEKTFDEYHLYSLPRPTTLHDRETKQVEFVRVDGVPSSRYYVYDGVQLDPQRDGNSSMESIRGDAAYGTRSNPKVWTMREFKNSEASHLGMPLPKGRVRFYRRDSDGQMEFTGENVIDHTPKDETVRIFSGSAFDLTGERIRTSFKQSSDENSADEAFEIKLRNHKKEPVEIRVIEHLYRWTNWEIPKGSDPWVKTDAQTIEFRVQVKPDAEKSLTYKVHYSW